MCYDKVEANSEAKSRDVYDECFQALSETLTDNTEKLCLLPFSTMRHGIQKRKNNLLFPENEAHHAHDINFTLEGTFTETKSGEKWILLDSGGKDRKIKHVRFFPTCSNFRTESAYHLWLGNDALCTGARRRRSLHGRYYLH